MSVDISKVEVGQTVRVTLVGKVKSVGVETIGIWPTDEGGYNFFAATAESIEVLPEPEPTWVAGDIVKDASGRLYECYSPATSDTSGQARWGQGGTILKWDEELRRPLEVIRKVES